MARLARVVVDGTPHYITQRGNRRQQTFFGPGDYVAYLELLAQFSAENSVRVWAYCLMPNHVHLILVPDHVKKLARAIGETHRRYTRMVNLREGWRGYLWQGRFASFPMDEQYLLAAARHILLNPVRSKLVSRAEDWPHSSLRAHLGGHDESGVVEQSGLGRFVTDWNGFLAREPDEDAVSRLRGSERTGRPLGTGEFLTMLETRLNRRLRPRRPGRKKGRKSAAGSVKEE